MPGKTLPAESAAVTSDATGKNPESATALPATRKTAARPKVSSKLAASPAKTAKAPRAKPAVPVETPKTKASKAAAPKPVPSKAPQPLPSRSKASGSKGKAEGGKAAKKTVKPRPVLVRDSFTMPEADFALIAQLKATALSGRRAAKKSELLRAGLQLLAALDARALVAALDRLEAVKTGRPKKGH